MHLHTFELLLASFITTSHTIALPPLRPRAQAAIDALDLSCVYFCTTANWTGTCQNVCGSTGICIDLPSDLAGQASSLGPNRGISGTQLFSAADCKESGAYLSPSGAEDVVYPGFGNLSTFREGKFDKNVRSFILY